MPTIGSPYSDAANVSRTGQKARTGDVRALFLTEFGGMVIESYDEAMDYNTLAFVKNITQGKSDTFPIIGRKRDAGDHTPGALVVGGFIEHNQVEISLDDLVFDAVFIPEIDELIQHYEVRGPYAKQLGQSLGSLKARRVAIMHIRASRVTSIAQGQPVPAYFFDANMKTSASAIADAAYKSQIYLKEQEISGEKPDIRLPHAQAMLLARDFGATDQRETAGSGNRTKGTVGQVYGLDVVGTNHIPSTNITTGPVKYQGDFTKTVGHIGTKMAVGQLARRGMTVKMKEQDERFGTLILASEVYGNGELRPEASIELATAARA